MCRMFGLILVHFCGPPYMAAIITESSLSQGLSFLTYRMGVIMSNSPPSS